MSRYPEVFLEIGFIICVIAVFAANSFSRLQPSGLPKPASRQHQEASPHKPPVASIYGVHLGDDKLSIDAQFPLVYRIKLGFADGYFYDYEKIGVHYDKHNRADLVNGDRLELDGVVKLSGKASPNKVEAVLGTPDGKGFSGAVMCEGEVPAYHYNSLNVTTDFSILGGSPFHLTAMQHFTTSDAAALKESIDFRRGGLR